MLDDLTKNTTVSATDDQDLLGVWVRVHGQMGDHLLVCELIPLSALDDIVENQDSAIVGRFEDEDILILALLVVEDILDLEGHSLTRPHGGYLAEPAIYEELLCQPVPGQAGQVPNQFRVKLYGRWLGCKLQMQSKGT